MNKVVNCYPIVSGKLSLWIEVTWFVLGQKHTKLIISLLSHLVLIFRQLYFQSHLALLQHSPCLISWRILYHYICLFYVHFICLLGSTLYFLLHSSHFTSIVEPHYLTKYQQIKGTSKVTALLLLFGSLLVQHIAKLHPLVKNVWPTVSVRGCM